MQAGKHDKMYIYTLHITVTSFAYISYNLSRLQKN